MTAARSSLTALLGLVLLAGCGAREAAGQDAAAPADRSRLADLELFVDPDSHPAAQARQLRESGRSAEADALEPLASRPIARWFTGAQQGDPYVQAQQLAAAAEAQGAAAVVTVYDLPGRDCGQFSSGGAPDDAAYVDYVGSLAAGLGDAPAVVVLEPDAVPHALQGCGDAQRTMRLLRSAVDMLSRQAGVRVYLDAGNASWVDDLPRLGAALRDSGLDEADGFALNVANFETTEDSTAYGRRLSNEVGGARFVIDTSRNGAGPPSAAADGAHPWCNPPGRRLGQAPTTRPGLPGVDALLWVKSPGDSDGTCGAAPAPAGQWSPELARELLGAAPAPG